MKIVKRTSFILKVIGIVLILLSLVLGLYALINTGASKEALDQGMNRYGAQGRWTDAFTSDRHFFSAMSRSAGNRDRTEEERLSAIDPDFRSWFDRIEASARGQEEDICRSFAAFLAGQTPETLNLNALNEQQENRELREIFEYINALSVPPKKGKIALTPASQEPFFLEYYEAFSQEHGEESGVQSNGGIQEPPG